MTLGTTPSSLVVNISPFCSIRQVQIVEQAKCVTFCDCGPLHQAIISS